MQIRIYSNIIICSKNKAGKFIKNKVCEKLANLNISK